MPPHEPEFPLTEEQEQELLHQVKVQLYKRTQHMDAGDIADSLLFTPEPEADWSLITVRIADKVVHFRLPGWAVSLMDRACVAEGKSRSQLISDMAWDFGVPRWLVLINATDTDLSGSVSYALKGIEKDKERFEMLQALTKKIEPTMDYAWTLCRTPTKQARIEAGNMIAQLVGHIEDMDSPYWRHMAQAEVLSFAYTWTMIGILEVEEIPAGAGLREIFQAWERVATGFR